MDNVPKMIKEYESNEPECMGDNKGELECTSDDKETDCMIHVYLQETQSAHRINRSGYQLPET